MFSDFFALSPKICSRRILVSWAWKRPPSEALMNVEVKHWLKNVKKLAHFYNILINLFLSTG